MTRAQADAVVEALAASDLETIRAARELSATLERAVLTFRTRVASIEQERQRAVVAALTEADGA